ncbi:MAG: class I SAM-dependent methyltransferase [Proteiniphilum sp.]|nr:class I SAM-dependent methyltransferase [Proteiniphilum sp.]
MYTLCPLCEAVTDKICTVIKNRKYYRCAQCDGVFMDSAFLPDRTEEAYRYREHNNDVYDDRYRAFVSPIVEAVLENFTAENRGLDFGAGTGPVISKMLEEKGYDIRQYDPFFHADRSLLNKQYDYVVACEVIEHFHYPASEFLLLRGLLNDNGKLYCRTSILHPEQNFESWYYKDDPTHVFFYSPITAEKIRDKFGFKRVDINGNLIIFSV